GRLHRLRRRSRTLERKLHALLAVAEHLRLALLEQLARDAIGLCRVVLRRARAREKRERDARRETERRASLCSLRDPDHSWTVVAPRVLSYRAGSTQFLQIRAPRLDRRSRCYFPRKDRSSRRRRGAAHVQVLATETSRRQLAPASARGGHGIELEEL